MDGYDKGSGGGSAVPDEPGPVTEGEGTDRLDDGADRVDGAGGASDDDGVPVTEGPPATDGARAVYEAPATDGSAATGGPPATEGALATDGPSATDSAPARAGIAGLKLGYQVVAACALALVGVAACAHIAMLFLHVAPSNTLTKQHGDVVDDWIYPEFEQNWKLFAPNPLQQNVAVQARAELRTAGGTMRTTDWYELSAEDGAAIDGSLLPSHTQQNELRRAWDFYVGSHDAKNRPVGLRGQLSEQYIRRIAYLRLDRKAPGGKGDEIANVQLRSKITNVRPPKWSEEKVSTKPSYRQLPWWPVKPGDLPLGKGPESENGAQGPVRTVVQTKGDAP
ncbi:DUF5819 family protein [Streptomyces sp. NPDC005562]|uniref:DUF5819 family protein n=1 Tax=unclassified Streptomyces TaxID=2593676 RepID=UPI0033AC7927